MLKSKIKDYYKKRGLKWPKNSWQALGWLHSEIGEVYELLQAREGGWVRNNPDEHDEFARERLAEELGDCVMMLYVAGIVEGVDIEQGLLDKMERKLAEPSGGHKLA